MSFRVQLLCTATKSLRLYELHRHFLGLLHHLNINRKIFRAILKTIAGVLKVVSCKYSMDADAEKIHFAVNHRTVQSPLLYGLSQQLVSLLHSKKYLVFTVLEYTVADVY